MGKVKVELNHDAVRDQLLKSQEMMEICAEHARGILGRCGDGYAMDTHVGKNRVNAMVYPETIRAKRSNAKHNTILKAIKG